jgi:hypothetical protein
LLEPTKIEQERIKKINAEKKAKKPKKTYKRFPGMPDIDFDDDEFNIDLPE